MPACIFVDYVSLATDSVDKCTETLVGKTTASKGSKTVFTFKVTLILTVLNSRTQRKNCISFRIKVCYNKLLYSFIINACIDIGN